jgi:hypothetical protein
MEKVKKIGLSQINLMASKKQMKDALTTFGIETVVNDTVAEPHVEYSAKEFVKLWNKFSFLLTLDKIENDKL